MYIPWKTGKGKPADMEITPSRQIELNCGKQSADLIALLGRRPRVVIGHPYLGRGGSEARVMWLIEALKLDCDLTVVTTGGWDLQALNRAYGTQVQPQDAEVRLAPFPRLLQRYPLAMLRWAYFQRFCRQIADQFDVRISAYNCTDWGLPAIQFIADFAWDPVSRNIDGGAPPGLFYRNTPLRKAYLAWARSLMRPSGRDPLRQDWVVANSHWSARKLAEMGSRVRSVIYPSVWQAFPLAPWEQRENAFVSLSRIAPEKRIEDIIQILDAVRRRGYFVNLYLAGSLGHDGYGRYIEDLCRRHADWIRPVGYVSGEAKIALLTRCRYSMSARPHEAFGIAVAEMVRAGCIPFVCSTSGAAEVVDHSALLFSNTAEAEERVVNVLDSEQLQGELRNHLARQSERFSLQQTIEGARRVVAGFLQEVAAS
jgi:glycosyltransferase involved in cell wall biosynthesis